MDGHYRKSVCCSKLWVYLNVIPEKFCLIKNRNINDRRRRVSAEVCVRAWKWDRGRLHNRRLGVATNIAVSLDFEPLSGRLVRVSISDKIDSSSGRAFEILRARNLFLMWWYPRTMSGYMNVGVIMHMTGRAMIQKLGNRKSYNLGNEYAKRKRT